MNLHRMAVIAVVGTSVVACGSSDMNMSDYALWNVTGQRAG